LEGRATRQKGTKDSQPYWAVKLKKRVMEESTKKTSKGTERDLGHAWIKIISYGVEKGIKTEKCREVHQRGGRFVSELRGQ